MFFYAAAYFDEAVIAQKTAKLTEDERDGIGGKGGAVACVEAVDGLEEADDADLKEIFGVIASAPQATHAGPYEAGVLCDKLITALRIALLCLPDQLQGRRFLRGGGERICASPPLCPDGGLNQQSVRP